MNSLSISELESLSEKVLSSPNSDSSQSLLSFFNTTSSFSYLYSILLSSHHPYLLYLTASSITKRLQSEWKTLSSEEKQSIYYTLMNLIFNPETTSNYLVGGLCKTLARVCRLAWKDIEAITNVVNSIEDIINQQILQAEKGFKFFEEIISEMVENVPHLTVSLSKRTAIVFRDTGLGEILNFTVFTLLNLKNIPAGLNKQLLHIINLCFSFDFLAGISDKTIEDPNSLQVPLSWKTHFSSPELLQKVELLILSNCLNEIEYASIRVLNQMGAVRKTIFQELDEKHQFIYRYSSVLLNIFKEKILSEDSLFEFLQTIKRFFSNFLVKEIALAIDFNVFLEHLARFSFKLFTDANCLFSNDYNSIPIWAFLSFEARSHCDFISNYIPLIFDAFTENSLNFVTEENFLSENFAKNKTQLEKLGIFSVYFYDKVYVLLQKRIQAENEFIQSRITREYQVSWLVMIASSFISTDDKKSGEEINDLLVHTLLQLINSVDHSPFCIQLSILTFFQSFTKTYLCSSMDNQWGDSDSMIGNISVGQVTDLLIEFLLKNLSQYKQGTILEETMSLFEKVCIGYYSSKILLSLPQARALLRYPNCLFTNRKLRRRFFTVLTQLWAAEESASAEFYEKLVVKIRNSRRTFEEIQVLFIEIQGIFKAIGKSEGYMELFELIQEDIWAITQNYYIGMISDPETLKCMLLMFKEITENRNERIDFNLSDAHGIIMFKNISEILVHYAPIDTGESVMKKASLFLGIVNNMISGEYISFGVFEIYQDEILNKILLVCFDLISGLTTDFTTYPKLLNAIYKFIEYLCLKAPKNLFLNLPSYCFSTVLEYLLYAMRSGNIQICLTAGNCIDYLCEFMLKSTSKNNQIIISSIKTALADESEKLTQIYETLIENVLVERSGYAWGLCKALLALAVIDLEKYNQSKYNAICRVSSSFPIQEQLTVILNNLFAGIQQNLTEKNKENFLKNFGVFKQIITRITL